MQRVSGSSPGRGEERDGSYAVTDATSKKICEKKWKKRENQKEHFQIEFVSEVFKPRNRVVSAQVECVSGGKGCEFLG